MKKFFGVFFVLSIFFTSIIFSMECDSDSEFTDELTDIGFYQEEKAYPPSIGYVKLGRFYGAEKKGRHPMAAELELLPAEYVESVNKLIKGNPGLLELCKLKKHLNIGDYKDEIRRRKESIEKVEGFEDNSYGYVFAVNKTLYVKIADYVHRLRNRLSSKGKDPYNTPLTPEIIEQATEKDDVIQHVTTPAFQALIKKRKSNIIQAVRTWLLPIENQSSNYPPDITDSANLIVQEKLDLQWKSFKDLTPDEKGKALEELPLDTFYADAKFVGIWTFSEEDTFYNAETKRFAFPNLQSPNNEGNGMADYSCQVWKRKVIFGQDWQKADWNWRNPYDGGHRSFELLLKKYCPTRVEQWRNLYKQDPDVSQDPSLKE